MGQNHIEKSVERLLQSIDDVIGAQQGGGAPGNSELSDLIVKYKKNLDVLAANLSRLQSGHQEGGILKLSKTWIDVFFNSKLALRIGLVLATVREQVKAATSGAGPVSRHDTWRLVITAGQAAFILLHRSSCAVIALHAKGSSKADKRKGMEALTALAQQGFMKAVADCASAISAFAASLRAEAGESIQAATASINMDGVQEPIADAICKHMYAVVLLSKVYAKAVKGRGTDPRAVSVAPEASTILGSLVASGLVAAAAAAVVDCPCTAGVVHIHPHIHLSRAGSDAAQVMAQLAALQRRLAFQGGQEGRRLACGLLRATRHVAVRRLQVALLDQLAAHAGMGAELGAGEDGWQEEEDEDQKREEQQDQVAQEQEDKGQQAQEQQAPDALEQQRPPTRKLANEPGAGGRSRPGEREQAQAQAQTQTQEQQVQGRQARSGCAGQEQADGWAGSSGAWWFAREEARRGELLGPQDGEEEHVAGGPTAGWLEGRHCDIVSGTLWAWQTAEDMRMEEEARVPEAPPPVLRARLAARAAEALCRLCRGQGLEGAYAPAPQWELAMAERLVQGLLPTRKHADSLPAATARACLPYWLEAAGWAAALMSDATAAAMGRLPSTRREEVPVHALTWLAEEGSEAVTLECVLALTEELAGHEAYGVQTLSDAACHDVRRRLFRCGAAASLDHTLRLAYSAQNGGQAGTAPRLDSATNLTSLIAYWGLAPLFPPKATAGEVSSSGCGQDRAGGSGGLGAGGDGTREAIVGGSGSSGIDQAWSSEGGAGQEAHGGGGGSTSAGGGLAVASGSVGHAGGGSSISGGGGTEAEAGDQLGLLLTLSKRAAMLTRALEAGAGAGAAGVDGQGQGQGDPEGPRGPMDMASDVLEAFQRPLAEIEYEVQRRLQEVCGKGPDAGGDVADATCQARDTVCLDEAHEALALAARAASNLAATYAWRLAAEVAGGTTAAGESAVQLGEGQFTAVLGVLDCLFRWCRPPMLLPPAQLLACQPHRLLVAACASPKEDDDRRQSFGQLVAMLTVALSAHEALSGRVRSWLAPSPSAAAAAAVGTDGPETKHNGGPGGGNDGDACAGCLAAPLQHAIRPALGRPFTAEALVLLRLAAGEAVGPEGDTCCCPGGGGGDGAAWEADGGFKQFAAAVYDMVQKFVDDPAVREAQEPVLPGGSHRATDVLERDLGAGSNQPQPPQPLMAPTWPLPPPLVLPPGRALATPRLRVCGNPRCSNFGCEGEWALPLKQCGGCRAVRYCGADCQRAHWREGHKAECKALAAGMASR